MLDADIFLKGAVSDSKPLEDPTLSQTIPEADGDVRNELTLPEMDVWDTVITPSGIEIRFQHEPKRKYEVRDIPSQMPENDATNPWFEVPSVTQILDVLEKGGLSWWGMKVGAAGVKELYDTGVFWDRIYRETVFPDTVDEVIDLLKAHKLTVNHIRNKAGDRGNSLHAALQYWSENGTLPDPEFYPETEQGYVKGLVGFLEDAQIEPIQSEVMVGSVAHGFAGRYDLLGLYGGREVCVHTTPSGRGSKRESLEPGIFMFDLKTSKGVYSSQHFQLSAYAEANRECGYESSDSEAIVRVTDGGKYEVVQNRSMFEDFEAVHSAWKAVERLK